MKGSLVGRNFKRKIGALLAAVVMMTSMDGSTISALAASASADARYLDEGRSYDISELSQNYQLFVRNDVDKANHTVGAIVVGGKFYSDNDGNANTFGDVAVAPSYIDNWARGNIGNGSTAYVNSSSLDRTVYYNKKADGISGGTHNADYLNVEEAFDAIKKQSKGWESISKEVGGATLDLKGVDDEITYVKMTMAQFKTINILVDDVTWFRNHALVVTVEGVSGNSLTYANAAKINGMSLFGFAQEYSKVGNNKLDAEINGFNLFWNLPDATGTVNCYESAGHIIAPNAKVIEKDESSGQLGKSNYQGIIVAKSAEGLGEGHFWPSTIKLANDFEDTPDVKTGSVKVTKINESNNKLADANIGLYSDKECTKLVASGITGSDGTVLFEDIEVGTYYLKEINPPKGYSLNTSAFSVAVVEGETNSDVSIKDEKVKPDTGIIRGQKVGVKNGDSVEAGLAGAVIALYNVKTGEKIGTAVSDAYGYYCFYDVPMNVEYFVKEEKAPEGYEIDEGEYRYIYANDQGGSNVPTIKNKKIPAKLTLKKCDSNGKTLSGAEMELEAQFNVNLSGVSISGPAHQISGGKITWKSTDESLVISGLPAGTYIYRETSAPEGYIKSSKEETIEIDNINAENIEKTIYNAKKPDPTYSISLQKVDGADNSGLAGAKLKLTAASDIDLSKVTVGGEHGDYNVSGNAITWTSAQGAIVLNNMPAGTYSWVEESAPEGYQMAVGQTVIVSEDSVKSYTMVDLKENTPTPEEPTDTPAPTPEEPTDTPTPTPEEPTDTPTPEVSHVPEASASPEVTAEVSPSPTPDATATAIAKATEAAHPTATAIAKATEAAHPTATAIAKATEAAHPTATAIAKATEAAHPTATAIAKATEAAHPTATAIAKATEAAHPTATAIAKATEAAKPTATATPTNEPTATPVPTKVVEPTATAIAKATEAAHPTATAVAKATEAAHPTATPVPTKVVEPTATPAPTKVVEPTETPVPKTATVTFSKEETGAAGKEIPGAELTLTSTSGADLSKVSRVSGPFETYNEKNKSIEWISAEEPLVLEGLKPGDYVMHEEVAPHGYTVATDIKFTVNNDGTITVEGATARVLDQANKNIVLMTDDAISKATVTFSKEETGAAGKEIPGAEITLTSTADLSKVERVSGPEKTYNEKNKSIEWISAEEPLVLEGLKPGDYVMHEEVAPHGYTVATDIKFTVNNDGTITVEGATARVLDQANKNIVLMTDDAIAITPNPTPDITVTPAPEAATVTFSKEETNAAGAEIPGAKLTLTSTSGADLSNVKGVSGPKPAYNDKDNSIVWISTEEALKLEGLEPGTYVMHEEVAPHGYGVATDITFTVKADGKISVQGATARALDQANKNIVLMTDDAIVKATVTFSKEETGAAGKEIPGAEITLTSSTGSDLSEVKGVSGPKISYDAVNNKIVWISGTEAVKLEGLMLGSYVMHEEVAPHGYTVATDIRFTVNADGKITVEGATAEALDKANENIVLMTDDAIVATVKFSKEETGAAGKEIPGAKITLTSDSNVDFSKIKRVSGPNITSRDNEKKTISWTSGSTALELSGLMPGTYVMHEIAAPSGYAVATDITFTVNVDKTITVEGASARVLDQANENIVLMTDDAIPSLNIVFTKTNEDGSKKLSGARFGLYKDADLRMMYKGTSSNSVGRVTFSNINASGTYYIKELTAPGGYILSDKIYVVNVDLKNQKVTYGDGFVTEPNGSDPKVRNTPEIFVTLSKEQTGLAGKEIPGAQLTLTSNDGKSLEKVTKENAKGPAITYDKSKNSISWTSSDVELRLKGLLPGSYTMHEVAAPHGYAVATDIVFTVNEDGSLTATGVSAEAVDKDKNLVLMVDDAIPDTIDIEVNVTYNGKPDSSKGERDETTVAVYSDKECTDKIDEKVLSREEGNDDKNLVRFTIDELGFSDTDKVKKYYIKEDKKPDSYEKEPDFYEVTIKWDNDKNSPTYNELTVEYAKIDPKTGIPGTPSKEIPVLNNITITPSKEGATVVISKIGLELEGEEIAGAGLELTCLEGGVNFKTSGVEASGGGSNVKIEADKITWTSGTNPEVFKDMPDGTYRMLETVAPEGYEKVTAETYIEFTIKDGKLDKDKSKSGSKLVFSADYDEESKLSVIKLVNGAAQTMAKISKQNLGAEIPGAKMRLTCTDPGEDLMYIFRLKGGKDFNRTSSEITWTTTGERIVLSNMADKEYILEEIEAPEGYLPAAPIHFETKDGIIVKINGISPDEKNDLPMVDLVDPGELDVTFYKVDADNNKKTLTGGTYELFADAACTESLGTSTADSTGLIKFAKVQKLGKLYIKEKAAPSGYYLSETIYEIEIKKIIDGREAEFGTHFIKREDGKYGLPNKAKPTPTPDTKITGSIAGTKYGQTGDDTSTRKVLKGAVIGLFTSKSVSATKENAIRTYTTSKSGTFKFDNLTGGTYYIREISAPAGYSLDETWYERKITYDKQEINDVDIVDKKNQPKATTTPTPTPTATPTVTPTPTPKKTTSTSKKSRNGLTVNSGIKTGDDGFSLSER